MEEAKPPPEAIHISFNQEKYTHFCISQIIDGAEMTIMISLITNRDWPMLKEIREKLMFSFHSTLTHVHFSKIPQDPPVLSPQLS